MRSLAPLVAAPVAALVASLTLAPGGAFGHPVDRPSATVPRAATVHMRPDAWEATVVRLTNARRRAHGVGPLRASRCAHRFAAPWARHLARTHQLVHHLPLNPLLRCVPHPHTAGENIAEGFETPRAVVRAWMSDKGHRDNLLNPAFHRIAVAGARQGRGPTYAVQDFVG